MAPKQSLAARRMARARGVPLAPLTVIVRPQQCVAYGRVSSDKQREDQTIETQKNLLIGDITARDRADLPESEQRKLVGQFWDDGVTGTIPLERRPEGTRLVSLICRRGDMRCRGDCGTSAVIDVVWITKLDRLARRLQILIETEAFFRAHGVALRSLEFNIDTSTTNGKLMFHILGVIAEWEIETIRERTNGGKRTKASEGKSVGGRPAFGLKTDEDGYFVVDTTLVELVDNTKMAACDVVKAIFDNIALNGSTAWQEAEHFGLTQRKVLNILHNRKYKGEGGMYADGQWISAGRNAPPQLVSPEIWELAQGKLADNKKLSSRNRHYDYLLSQILICCEPYAHPDPTYYPDGAKQSKAPRTPGICGRAFCGRRVRSGEHVYAYYTCTRAGMETTACTAKPLRGTLVEDTIWALVADAQRHPEAFIEETLREIDHTALIRNLRLEITGIMDHLARLETERHTVLRQEQKGHLTPFEADTRMADIAAESEPLHDHKRALEQQLHSVSVSATDLKRADIVSADIVEQLDRIEAQCASSDTDVVSTGRRRKAAIIRATIERAEVRMKPGGEHHLTLFLRFGQALPVDLPSLQQEEENPQHSIMVVREIVLPRTTMGPPKGWKPSAA